jgi:hypothetical protein
MKSMHINLMPRPYAAGYVDLPTCESRCYVDVLIALAPLGDEHVDRSDGSSITL